MTKIPTIEFFRPGDKVLASLLVSGHLLQPDIRALIKLKAILVMRTT